MWKTLKGNIGSLAAFVDALVMNKPIPIFNWTDSASARSEASRLPGELDATRAAVS